jgi:hypothetical protein
MILGVSAPALWHGVQSPKPGVRLSGIRDYGMRRATLDCIRPTKARRRIGLWTRFARLAQPTRNGSGTPRASGMGASTLARTAVSAVSARGFSRVGSHSAPRRRGETMRDAVYAHLYIHRPSGDGTLVDTTVYPLRRGYSRGLVPAKAYADALCPGAECEVGYLRGGSAPARVVQLGRLVKNRYVFRLAGRRE